MSAIVTTVPHSTESCVLEGASVRVLGVDAMWSLALSCYILEMRANARQLLIVSTLTTHWYVVLIPTLHCNGFVAESYISTYNLFG